MSARPRGPQPSGPRAPGPREKTCCWSASSWLHLLRSWSLRSTRRGSPLDEFGHIDPQLWQRYRDHCRVRRFWQAKDDQIGCLVHRSGSAEHARWVFDYDPETWIDDDAGYRFGAHKFAPGEYVSIHDDAGELHTFQVTSVQPVS